MTELNKLTGIVVGQYGVAIPLTICDSNGVAVDVSAYTTSKNVTIRDPFTLKIITRTVTFVTNGTNGQVQFTPQSSDFDRDGKWEGQIRLESANAVAKTKIFEVEVEKNIATTP